MEETTVIVVWILTCTAFIVVLVRWFVSESKSDYIVKKDYTLKDFYTKK